jgi:hypothetical protein
MKLFKPQPIMDASTIRGVLEAFRDEVCESVGAELKSLIVYGAFVRNQGFEHQNTTVNVMAVLGQTDSEILDKLAIPTATAATKIPFSVMTLTKADLQSSCDVFPIKFQEMQLHYRVLTGEDVLCDLRISDEHLRLRCEQRLKNLLLRLRAAYLQHNLSSQHLQSVLFDARDHLLRDMGACLMVKSGMQPEDAEDVADAFADEFGIAIDVVTEIDALQKANSPAGLEDIKSTYDSFMRLVELASAMIDNLEVER